MSRVDVQATPQTTDAPEIFDVLGPRVQFLTPLSNNDDEYCLIRGTFPAGVAVPLHSHAERETFYLLEGEMQGFWQDRWVTLGEGAVFDVPGGLKHGCRHVSKATASVLVVVPMRLARFLREIGRPLAPVQPSSPKPDDLRRFLELAHEYGYWLGSPEDNATIGIKLG